jgi:hypothetical protein
MSLLDKAREARTFTYRPTGQEADVTEAAVPVEARDALVELADAATVIDREYALWEHDANDGVFAIWSSDRLMAAIYAQRAALERLRR